MAGIENNGGEDFEANQEISLTDGGEIADAPESTEQVPNEGEILLQRIEAIESALLDSTTNWRSSLTKRNNLAARARQLGVDVPDLFADHYLDDHSCGIVIRDIMGKVICRIPYSSQGKQSSTKKFGQRSRKHEDPKPRPSDEELAGLYAQKAENRRLANERDVAKRLQEREEQLSLDSEEDPVLKVEDWMAIVRELALDVLSKPATKTVQTNRTDK